MEHSAPETWQNSQKLTSRQYVCGFCSNKVGSALGYLQKTVGDSIYICPHCSKPTFFGKNQMPGPLLGIAVGHLPKDIDSLYSEARRSFAGGSYTATVLICRKLIMNVAVNLGANENQSFMAYVEYMSEKGYVPPNGKGWVDHIRVKGNEANHEIILMGVEDAKELLDFLGMLLKFIFEFPNTLPKKSKSLII